MSDWETIGLTGLADLLKIAAFVPSPIQPELEIAEEVTAAVTGLWSEVAPLIRSGQAPTVEHTARASAIVPFLSSYRTRGRNPISGNIA